MKSPLLKSATRTVDAAHRGSWFDRRRKIEEELGGDPHMRWAVLRFRVMSRILHLLVLGFGLSGLGRRNALDIRLSDVEFSLPNLPPSFDGYKILHLSDLHFDTVPGIGGVVRALLEGRSFDACILTGDFSDYSHTPISETVAHIGNLCNGIDASDGIFCTLGNHDRAALVGPAEALGIRFLLNESIIISRGADKVVMTGVDDVNAFWSVAADRAMRESGEGCKLAFVHSPEFASVAMTNGFALYLAGHTHGGQVCLPGGRPLATGLRLHKEFFRGKWRHGDMAGYTNSGVGVSNIPVRFNCPGEVAVITLRAAG
jgi:uncharacterized protein